MPVIRWPQSAFTMRITQLASTLSGWLPSCCALCGATCAGVVCAPCQADVVQPRLRCRRCANPVAELGRHCGACLAALPAFDATVAAFDYATPLDQLVLQLKFGARLQLAPWFARLLRDAIVGQAGAGLCLPDVLAPVPLGARRLAERGFNQALEVARPLSRMLGVPLSCQVATRVVETAPQSSVAPSARAANVRGAFAIASGAVAGLHVGIVDDVMTSGRTLDALARTLKAAGAARVSNFVVARTPPR